MGDKKEATKKFHEITEAKDALLGEEPGGAAQPLSAQKAYEEFKKRQSQTWEESWEDREKWRNAQRDHQRKQDSQWKGPKPRTDVYHGNDVVAWILLVLCGAYVYAVIQPPPKPVKRPSVSDVKPKVPLGLTDLHSHRIYNPTPVTHHHYVHKGRQGPHTAFLQMTDGPARPDALFKCLTCNTVVSKATIDHHVRRFGHKSTILD